MFDLFIYFFLFFPSIFTFFVLIAAYVIDRIAVFAGSSRRAVTVWSHFISHLLSPASARLCRASPSGASQPVLSFVVRLCRLHSLSFWVCFLQLISCLIATNCGSAGCLARCSLSFYKCPLQNQLILLSARSFVMLQIYINATLPHA